jgi:uncharacterized protein RhaS with RHS repeats
LIYYGFRFYEPEISRWLTRDPLGEAGGMNLYAFVGNNPVNWVDPWGLALTKGVVARRVVRHVGPMVFRFGPKVGPMIGLLSKAITLTGVFVLLDWTFLATSANQYTPEERAFLREQGSRYKSKGDPSIYKKNKKAFTEGNKCPDLRPETGIPPNWGDCLWVIDYVENRRGLDRVKPNKREGLWKAYTNCCALGFPCKFPLD